MSWSNIIAPIHHHLFFTEDNCQIVSVRNARILWNHQVILIVTDSIFFVSSTAQSEALKESVFFSTNLVSAKCSLEDGSRASPYFQVSSLHRSLQFAFLHRQRTRHITSVGEKSNQDSDKFLQIFLKMFVFLAQGCPLFHANSDKGAPSWCTGAHTTFIIIWSPR